MRRHCLALLPLLALLSGCSLPKPPPLQPLPATAENLAPAAPTTGSIAPPAVLPRPLTSAGAAAPVPPGADPGAGGGSGGGAYSLDFADTDVREAVAQVLGGMLNLTYTIDPAVHGTVTLHTARPLSRAQLLPTLQALLADVGAALAQGNGLTRIVPAGAAGVAGTTVVPLRYASAEELVKVLQPLAGPTARIGAEPWRNAVVIAAPPGQVEPLVDLVRSFDVDELAGRSYAVLPVTSGNARDFAEALREALRGRAGGAPVQVVPLPRFDAVLVAASQPRFIAAATRVYTLLDAERRRTVRSWHVHYLQNSNADDIAYTLQMAFTPNNVTAQPAAQTGAGQRRTAGASGQSGGGLGGLGGSGGIGAAGGMGGAGGIGGAGGMGGAGGLSRGGGLTGQGGTASGSTGADQRAGATTTAPPAAGNPLLGGLDQTAGADNPDALRILSNPQNNAVLIYATTQEEESVLGMLRKIDIAPLQVRIDATIAEVTLNDQLQYGTQFFFKAGGINGILNLPASSTPVTGNLASTALSTSFPGFVLGGNQAGGGPLAISALQAVTTVNVLSSPQIMVVDNQPARLQVGALVPYLTSQSQSTLVANATVLNSVSYQPTGVILEVTPRINGGGLVTLDIDQEVSDVDTSAPTTSGITSPQFQERSVTSRVVVQDGQTIGLAGLIQDSVSRGNQGIPWLKDIPLLGLLGGQQNNTRTRTELLVLITPHVIHDQREARALTEDMREALHDAAAMPAALQALPASGSSDPGAGVRERVRGWVAPDQ